jgi:hypothetical protein
MLCIKTRVQRSLKQHSYLADQHFTDTWKHIHDLIISVNWKVGTIQLD